MSDKKSKHTELSASDAVELNETELDQVVGAGPVPYPDVGGSSSSSSTNNTSVVIDSSVSSSDSSVTGGTQKDIVSSKTTGPVTPVASSTNVKIEGKNITRFN